MLAVATARAHVSLYSLPNKIIDLFTHTSRSGYTQILANTANMHIHCNWNGIQIDNLCSAWGREHPHPHMSNLGTPEALEI